MGVNLSSKTNIYVHHVHVNLSDNNHTTFYQSNHSYLVHALKLDNREDKKYRIWNDKLFNNTFAQSN